MKVLEALDELRGRVVRLRQGRAFSDLAPLIGISRPTLFNFINGKPITAANLSRIEMWCDQEEACDERPSLDYAN